MRRGCNVCTACADVAQLVEQRFRKPQVTGSNPVVGSRLASQQYGERKLSRPNLCERERLISSSFFLPATAWQALHRELLKTKY